MAFSRQSICIFLVQERIYYLAPWPAALLKKPCVVARMEERGPPAEWAGQDWPGMNPFDSAKKGAKKGNRRMGFIPAGYALIRRPYTWAKMHG